MLNLLGGIYFLLSTFICEVSHKGKEEKICASVFVLE